MKFIIKQLKNENGLEKGIQCSKIKTQRRTTKGKGEVADILQKEKQNFLNRLLEKAETNRLQGNSRNFFRIIKKNKLFNPSLNAIKYTEGFILIKPPQKKRRLKDGENIL